MNNEPANVSPLWFFIKTCVLCVLVVVAFLQVRAMFRHQGSAVPHVAQVRAAPTIDKQAWLKKREEEAKQERTKLPDTQEEKSSKQPPKPSLTKALLDPETYAAVKGDYARRLDAPYGKLYKELNLDNSTLQKLRSLLAEKELTLAESQRLAKESGEPLSNNSLAALRNEVDGPIKELLGEEAYVNYKYYESTLHLRNHVNFLEQSLAYKSEPLTNEQYNAFVDALAELPESQFDSDRGAWMGNRGTQISDKTLKVASGILTPSQLAVYEREYEMRLLGQEIEKEDAKKAASAKKKSVGGKKNKK